MHVIFSFLINKFADCLSILPSNPPNLSLLCKNINTLKNQHTTNTRIPVFTFHDVFIQAWPELSYRIRPAIVGFHICIIRFGLRPYKIYHLVISRYTHSILERRISMAFYEFHMSHRRFENSNLLKKQHNFWYLGLVVPDAYSP